MEKDLDILRKIQRVEPPHNLYIKVVTRVQKWDREHVSLRWVWATAACLALLISVNLTAIQLTNKAPAPDLTDVFSLNAQNTLYHD
jgi:hypothetical protein